MSARAAYDAVVVGSGPNGLAAAITIAEAGRPVLVLEAESTIGGGARTEELTLPGFLHDVCSAIHPLAVASPCFGRWPLGRYGLEWIHPPAPLAHPLEGGAAALMENSIDSTATWLGPDGPAWRRLLGPLVESWQPLSAQLLSPLRDPRHPVLLARFAVHALRSAAGLACSHFTGPRARALLAGLAGHAILPLEMWASAAAGLALGAAGHAVGWPLPRGGARSLSRALAAHLAALGGVIETGRRVASLGELPPARAVLCDVTPRQLLKIAGAVLPPGFRRKLERFRYGPGVFKLDWALDGPIPWRSPECLRSATVHLGGTLEEIALSEREVWQGRCPERPYAILAQPSLFDPSRAPAGKHTAWAYCHVPNGSEVDMTARIERQVERFAPGFRDRILGRSALPPAALEAHNENLVGGGIGGGAMILSQVFTRPTWRTYGTPVTGLYLCSSSTPPGPGVHGMCGYFAAKAALAAMGLKIRYNH